MINKILDENIKSIVKSIKYIIENYGLPELPNGNSIVECKSNNSSVFLLKINKNYFDDGIIGIEYFYELSSKSEECFYILKNVNAILISISLILDYLQIEEIELEFYIDNENNISHAQSIFLNTDETLYISESLYK